MTEQIKRVEAYSLMDFAVELEKAFLEGYRLNITNDNFPTNFGTLYTAGMVKYQQDDTKEVKEVEDISGNKRGRKKGDNV